MADEIRSRLIRLYSTYIHEAVPTDRLTEKGALQVLFDFNYLMRIVGNAGDVSATAEGTGKQEDGVDDVVEALKNKGGHFFLTLCTIAEVSNQSFT